MCIMLQILFAAPAGAAVAPSSDGVSQSCKHVLDSNCRTPQSIWGVAVDDQIRCLECASGENNAIIAAAGCSAHDVGQYCQGKLLIPPTPYTTRSTGYTWTRYVGKDCTGRAVAKRTYNFYGEWLNVNTAELDLDCRRSGECVLEESPLCYSHGICSSTMTSCPNDWFPGSTTASPSEREHEHEHIMSCFFY